jgi:hypothetical protein
MLPTIEELRKNYEQFDNNKLTKLATEEANGLRPEALELIKQIIKQRGMPDQILKGIDAQFKEVTEAELIEYCEILRKLPCPFCNSTNNKLNATMTAKVVNYFVMTSYEKEIKIGCPTCLDRQNNDAMVKSTLFGLWVIPWGTIKTIQSMIFNNKMKRQNWKFEANDLLKVFVLERVGRIEANRDSIDELNLIIKNIR